MTEEERLREYLTLHMIEFDCACETHRAKLEKSIRDITAIFKPLVPTAQEHGVWIRQIVRDEIRKWASR